MRRSVAGVVIVALGAAALGCGSGEGPSGARAPSDVVLPLRHGAVTERTIDPRADGRAATAAVAGTNAFAVDLYRAVARREEGNVVVSPYSVTFALGMMYAGAAGRTADEMADVLHVDLPAERWHEGLNAYDLTLHARTAGSPTTWASADKVWAEPGLPLRDGYLDVLTGVYGSALAEADFAADPEAPRALINEWVGDVTDGRVPELFPAGSLGAATALVLVNAVALDAPWEFPFDPDLTRVRPFERLDGSSVDVATMHYDEYLPSALTEEYQAVELPYDGGALSMVVIVPRDFEQFESGLTPATIDRVVGSIESGGIHLTMPRWAVRTHVRLDDTLTALGMPSAFGPAADFSGMVEGGGLWIDRVEHEAFVQVDEEGTRAAAATGGAVVDSHGPTIDVDRPFVYVIRDRGAGTILFIGRVTDPSIEP